MRPYLPAYLFQKVQQLKEMVCRRATLAAAGVLIREKRDDSGFAFGVLIDEGFQVCIPVMVNGHYG